MPKLNPNDAPPLPEAVPSGMFILGFQSFKRRRTKDNTKDYLNVKLQVANPGAVNGKSFFTTLSLDLSKNGAIVRWNILCKQCRVNEEFELGSSDDGTAEEGDANIRRLFLGRAFKAEVGVTKSGQYTNNEVTRLIDPDQYSDRDREIIAEWERKYAEKGDNFGPPPDDRPSGGGDSYFDDRAPDDDDIPF